MHLESSKYSYIQLALPSLYNFIRNFESHVRDVEFPQDSCKSDAYSFFFSKELAKIIATYLKEKIEVHDLWIVGCYLHPFLCEIEFVSCTSIRNDYRTRIESMTRKLRASAKSSGNNQNDKDFESNELSANLRPTSDHSSNIVGRKRKFERAEFVDSRTSNYVNIDEVARYNILDIAQFRLDKAEFMSDPFTVL